MSAFSAYDVASLVGLIGVIVSLGSYSLLQLGYLRGQSYSYASLVIIAASCVAYSLVSNFNVSAFLIQISYIAISVVGMVRLFLMRRMARSSEEDRAFIARNFPDLPREHVRRFLSTGTWQDLSPGDVLAREGEALERLTYLSEGRVEVRIGGRLVGHGGSGAFVGELAFLTRDPATASVTAIGPGRALVFDSAALRRLIGRQPQVKLALLATLGGSTREKLLQRNREMLQVAPA